MDVAVASLMRYRASTSTANVVWCNSFCHHYPVALDDRDRFKDRLHLLLKCLAWYPNLTSRCTAGVADTCSRWTGSQLQTIQHATNTLYCVHLVLCASEGWQASRSSMYVRECPATETRANRTYRTGIPPDSRPISLRATRCAALHGGRSAHVFPGAWMSSPGAPVPVTASHTTGANRSCACVMYRFSTGTTLSSAEAVSV